MMGTASGGQLYHRQNERPAVSDHSTPSPSLVNGQRRQTIGGTITEAGSSVWLNG